MLMYTVTFLPLLLLAATGEATDCSTAARCEYLSTMKCTLGVRIQPSTLKRVCSSKYAERTKCKFDICCSRENIGEAAAKSIVETMNFLCSRIGTLANTWLQGCLDDRRVDLILSYQKRCSICGYCGKCKSLRDFRRCILPVGTYYCGLPFKYIFKKVTDPVALHNCR